MSSTAQSSSLPPLPQAVPSNTATSTTINNSPSVVASSSTTSNNSNNGINTNVNANTTAAPTTTVPGAINVPKMPNQQDSVDGNASVSVNVNALPVRAYLDKTLMPILLEGMAAVVRERPSDPVEYLAAFLLKHNPRRTSDEQQMKKD